MNKEENEIKDLYTGDQVIVWKDDDLTFLNVMNVTISIPNEMWDEIRTELKEL